MNRKPTEHERLAMPAGGWGPRPPRLTVTSPTGRVESATGTFLAVYPSPDGSGWTSALPHQADADPSEIMAQAIYAVVRTLIEEGMSTAGALRLAIGAALQGFDRVVIDLAVLRGGGRP